MKRRSFMIGFLFALAGVVSAATFNLFSPATGILKGAATTYVTTAATSTDVISLWSGCSATLALLGSGACGSVGLATVSVSDSITGNGTSGTPLLLSGDASAPGNSFFYGTNASGTKGWYAQSSATAEVNVSDSITGNGLAATPLLLSGDASAPGNSFFYGTNASGTKGWYAQSTTGTFTATLTGVTAVVTATATYAIIGKTVLLSFPAAFSGTSNTTALIVTGIPAAIQPATLNQLVPVSLEDNGLNVSGMVQISALTANLQFFRGVVNGTALQFSSAGFTASGAKGLNETFITYSIQ